MATASGIRAGRAFVELFADDSKLVRGLNAAKKRLQAFGSSVRAIGARMFAAGAVVAGPLSLAVKAASDMEETMNKFNVVFGNNADAMKAWGDQFAGQIGRSKKQIADFLAGTQDLLVPIGFEAGAAREMSQQLTGLAIDLASFNNMADADVLRDLHAALTGSGEVMKKYGVLVNEAAVKQELLNQGIDKNSASEQQKVLARLAIILRGTTAAQGDAARSAGSFANQMKALKAKVDDAAVEIGSALLPVVTPLVTKLASAVQIVADWIKQNSGLVVSIAKIAAVVAAAGLAFIVIGTAVSGFGATLGAIATVITTVGSAIGLVGSMIAALLSPIGLVIAGIAGLATYLLTSTQAGGEALSWLGNRFTALKDTALAAWKGIGDALAAGDLGLAAKILWLTLKMEWQKGVNALNQTWVKVKEFFLATWTEAVFGAASIATNAWAGLQAGWTETVDVMRDAWSMFTTFIAKNWNRVVGFLKQAWQKLKSLVTGEDSSAVQSQIDAETARMNQQLDDRRNRDIFEREQRRRSRLSEIEGQRTGTLDELNRQREAEHERRRDQFSGDLEQSESALAQARREWQQAIELAARKREEAAADDPAPERLTKPDELLQQLQSQLSGAGDQLQQTQDKVSVSGSFNAAAIRGLSAGNPQERTARASEETAKNTKRILQEAQHGGLTFA
ncbi:phage tail tape measure protein [Thalassoglobus polymorphus]|uniref:Uncharacterized protein n=1 Tax=Thalassoglobus polymorphus TaxID=2527994 RepID=A0A517QQV4_9PLAN|nr:phage tail tape measure protein [Thalassoglobus polymorphus]QDT33975.1 hypothetical protein Mal48_32320 [Thalassoglobus polymorphus]